MRKTRLTVLRRYLKKHGIIDWTDANSNITQRDGVNPFTYDRVIYGVQLEWAW